MKETLSFLLISGVYLVSLIAMYFFFKKKYESEKTTDKVLIELNEKIDIIAMPRNYIINIVQDEKEVDTSQFVDMVLNISEYIKSKEEKENPNGPTLQKIFFKDVKFSQFKIIN